MFPWWIVNIFVIIFCIRTIVNCFNFESGDPMVKKAPDDQKGSYFGFSVAQHKTTEDGIGTDETWLLVGAPLGQNLQPGSNRSGALFKCPLSTYDTDCEQVETDGKRVGEFDYGEEDEEKQLMPPGTDEIKDGQWLGVTVRSQKAGGVVLVCAHRYIQSPDLSKFHYGQGLCYLLDADLNPLEKLQLCMGRPMEKLHQQFGFCQLGTSISFVGDDFALMGAPGPYTWRGTAFGKVVVGDFLTKDKTVYHGPLSDTELIDKYSYLGMSVGGGHFWNKSEYIYISGAPRSKLKGQVYFFKKQNTEDLNISLVITGEQFASSFGYEILAADINNDGYDDLLVGAPFYYGDQKGGAVYIYYDFKTCYPLGNCTWDKVLYGKPQSRYGFAMTSLGDINKDGYNDVAIGAPYENHGHGTVYVYLGSEEGLIEQPSQVISFEQLYTLGYSLSGGMDMDNNGYPDLLVGAYESERVLLFKARPIIDIKIDIIGEELKNLNVSKKGCALARNNNYTCFSFKSCFTIGGKIGKDEKFNVKYQVSEEKKFVSRVWFNDPLLPDKRSSTNVRIVSVSSYSKRYCQEELVNIKDGISDILNPITFKVNYTLENNTFHTPILNKTSVKVFQATFQKECGNDDICDSYLILDVKTGLKENEFGYTVDNIHKEVVLDVSVTNNGESAYEAKVFIMHPADLSYINTLKDEHDNIKCSTSNGVKTIVVCDIGNPFQGNRSVMFRPRFEINKETKVQQIDLKIFVNSTSKEHSKKTSFRLPLILQKVAKFQISGKASSNLLYGGEVVGESKMQFLEDIGARVTHKYTIDNNGNWDLSNIRVNIHWPIQVSPGRGVTSKPGKWLLYLESIPEVYANGIKSKDDYCEVLDMNKVNELNLTLSNKNISEEAENLVLPEQYMKPSNESAPEPAPHTRRRRDVDYVVPLETVERGGLKRRIVVMDCNRGSAKCTIVTCTIRRLKKGNQADIDIKSRLWNSTLVEDYSGVDWVAIKSFADVEITDKTFNISTESVTMFSAETVAYPENVIPDTGLNWWVIGGAALAGLLLLILLIIILYKCGFFKRKRVNKDGMVTGNVQKKGEADHLLNENNK